MLLSRHILAARQRQFDNEIAQGRIRRTPLLRDEGTKCTALRAELVVTRLSCGIFKPPSARPAAAFAPSSAKYALSALTHLRCRLSGNKISRSRIFSVTEQQPLEAAQEQDDSGKYESASESSFQTVSPEFKADSPDGLFAAARAAALLAGEDHQSARISAAIAADAASVAASTAGLARSSAHDAAVAAERAAMWATSAADELADAAAAAEDLVDRIYALQAAESHDLNTHIVEALLSTAQAAAKAADTLNRTLADAAPQAIRSSTRSRISREPTTRGQPTETTSSTIPTSSQSADILTSGYADMPVAEPTDASANGTSILQANDPDTAESAGAYIPEITRAAADVSQSVSADDSETAASTTADDAATMQQSELTDDFVSALAETPLPDSADSPTSETDDSSESHPDDSSESKADTPLDTSEPQRSSPPDLSVEASDAPEFSETSQAPNEAVELDSRDAALEDPSEVTRNDQVMMQRALQLARRGVGFTEPNPVVGCVILDSSGQVVGEGYHPAAGQPHAEVFALRGAGQAAEGGTAYVTLEPCNHHGRTPPCALALVEARVARVVVGIQDPNPLVAGSGMQTLRDAGIVVAGPCEEEACREVNKEFMETMAALAEN